MKYTKIRLLTLGGVTVDFPFIGLDPDYKYILKAVDGIGPPEFDAPIEQTLFGGGVSQGRRPQGREPVIRIGLNPDWDTGETASDLRSELYGLLESTAGDFVEMQLMNDNTVVARTSGLIKTFEISTFVKDPEVQLTIAAISPYLEAPNATIIANPAKTSFVVNNPGNSRTGLEMAIRFGLADPQPNDFAITNQTTGQVMWFDYQWERFEQLHFNTLPGNKFVKWRNTAIDPWIDKLGLLAPDAAWLELRPGNNTISFSNANFEWLTDVAIPGSPVSFTARYWGV